MRYSCRHCQRINFVELQQAPVASPGLEGPLNRANDPIERVYIPLRGGRTAWSPWTFNPGLATGACVSSTKSILWQWRQEYRINIQVLLDDGNRIIIPQGNFKVFVGYIV